LVKTYIKVTSIRFMLIAGTDKLSLSFLHGDLGLYCTCVIKTIFFMVVQKYIVLKQGAS